MHTEKRLRLSGAENTGREAGGFMLSIDIEGMDADQIKRFALFLYEENQTKWTQLDEMIARLDEIGKDLKDVKRENASLLKALFEANSKAEKVVLEYKLRDKEYKTLEKKYRALV